MPAIDAPRSSDLSTGSRTARGAAPAHDIRTIRVGIAGLGQVGQAVARLAAAPRLEQRGLSVRIQSALVRDVERPRRCPPPQQLTTSHESFLRGAYDVVIETLGAIEPAREIVAWFLRHGIPVVSANKALVARHGPEFAAVAARRGISFRYEATALAGVPFLGALAARPLVSDVQHFIAIVNGTSNFVLSRLEAGGCSLDDAVGSAQALGLTEPDPSRDLDGLDAADKLALLATLFGWGTITASDLDVQGIGEITSEDLNAARSLGMTIRPIVWASRTGEGLSAFIGPALVSIRHPLATLSGTLSGIQLTGRFVSDLFFSGPGAGPDITAATVLDDVVEAVSTAARLPRVDCQPGGPVSITSPETGWFVRAQFPGLVPDASAAAQIFSNHGLKVCEVSQLASDARWLRIGMAARAYVEDALARVRCTHRVRALAIRSI